MRPHSQSKLVMTTEIENRIKHLPGKRKMDECVYTDLVRLLFRVFAVGSEGSKVGATSEADRHGEHKEMREEVDSTQVRCVFW